MKRLYHYSAMLVLTILSIISLLVFEVSAYTHFVVFQPQIYYESMLKGRVDEIIYNDLVEYFQGFSGPTGIPAEVFTAPLNQEELFEASYWLTVDSLIYLVDETATEPTVTYDFSKVENYVDAYIEQYSDYNNIPKDKNYYALIQNTHQTIESQIKGQLDVALLYKLAQSSYVNGIRDYAANVQLRLIVSGILLVLFVAAMIIVDRKHPRDLPYWFGITLVISSAIILAPALYLDKINYFDNFFMRSDNVYKTVTNVCHYVLSSVINTETLILIFGFFLIFLTIIIHTFYIKYLNKKHQS